MVCQSQCYRWDTEELQAIADHNDYNYQCDQMSDCPYIGTSIINKILWAEKAGDAQEEDQDVESGTCRERN